MKIAHNGTQEGKPMWPSFAIASRLYDVANFAFIASLVIGVAATVLLVWMGNVKEGYLRRDVALAIARAADANERAAKAALQLAKLKAPRKLTTEQQTQIGAAVKKFAGQKFSGMVVQSSPDAHPLWSIIAKVLTDSGWILEKPRSLAAGSPPAGIPLSPGEGVTLFVPANDVPDLAGATNALDEALRDAGLKVVEAIDSGPQSKPKTIAIEIGTKPL